MEQISVNKERYGKNIFRFKTSTKEYHIRCRNETHMKALLDPLIHRHEISKNNQIITDLDEKTTDIPSLITQNMKKNHKVTREKMFRSEADVVKIFEIL
jgi:hypothetical protein